MKKRMIGLLLALGLLVGLSSSCGNPFQKAVDDTNDTALLLWLLSMAQLNTLTTSTFQGSCAGQVPGQCYNLSAPSAGISYSSYCTGSGAWSTGRCAPATAVGACTVSVGTVSYQYVYYSSDYTAVSAQSVCAGTWSSNYQ